MLRDASVELAAGSRQFTSVASTEASLDRLDKALHNGPTVHHQIQLDWSHSDEFLTQIKEHVSNTCPVDLAVAWVHDDQLTLRLAIALAESKVPFGFVHIIGSASVNPAGIAARLLDDFDPPSNLDYHQVILGAKNTGRRYRWLTDREISDGVLEAINHMKKQFVAGTLDRYN